MQTEIIPSEKQQAIYDFIEFGTGNAVIDARAGSGKTTTIVNASKKIPVEKSSIFLAFNKGIVGELKTRLPNVKTLHSLGWSALIKHSKPVLDKDKVSKIVFSLKTNWILENPEIDADYLGRVIKLVGLAKNNLVSNPDLLDEVAEKHGVEVLNGESKRAIEALRISFKDNETYDYNDQIFVPAVKLSVKLPTYDFIFIDECQDLNKAQQRLFTRIMHENSRFIAVGDPHQAIYGFAGADTDSFKNLQSLPNTVTLPLSCSYRLPLAIVKLAQTIVPDIEAAPNAKAGTVNWSASEKDILDGDLVLCRNTVPLVKLCLEKISQGIKAYVKGGDIGANLINVIKKQKVDTLKKLFRALKIEQDVVFKKLKANPKNKHLTDAEIMELSSYRLFGEKIQVLKTIALDEQIKNCEDLKNRILQIFSDEKSGICFSTIHKAKGLEAERVHIIDPQLMPSTYAKKPWEVEQEENLRYVAYTRSKDFLGFIIDWTFYETDKKRLSNSKMVFEED